jgi:restriction system protein
LSLTDDARKLLRQTRIQCLDAEAVLRLIAGRTEAERQTLLAVALQGEYWRPTCPGCGFKMAQRAHGAEGGRLWACASRHACQHTLAF